MNADQPGRATPLRARSARGAAYLQPARSRKIPSSVRSDIHCPYAAPLGLGGSFSGRCKSTTCGVRWSQLDSAKCLPGDKLIGGAGRATTSQFSQREDCYPRESFFDKLITVSVAALVTTRHFRKDSHPRSHERGHSSPVTHCAVLDWPTGIQYSH
jgi:hypothetical protein